MRLNPVFEKEMKRNSRSSRISWIIFVCNLLLAVVVWSLPGCIWPLELVLLLIVALYALLLFSWFCALQLFSRSSYL